MGEYTSAAVPVGYGGYGGYGGHFWTSTGVILVLFILLVIVLRACLY